MGKYLKGYFSKENMHIEKLHVKRCSIRNKSLYICSIIIEIEILHYMFGM
jgi:hypothetical protein